MSLFGALFAFLMLQSSTFNMAISFYAVYFTVSDGFLAPILSMLSLAAPANAKGQVMGYFVTVISVVGILMPITVTSMLAKDPKSMSNVAFTLMINCCIPNTIGALCFFVGGFHFAREMQTEIEEKQLALEAAVLQIPEIREATYRMQHAPTELSRVSQHVK